MTREEFEKTNWKMSFEEYNACDCSKCARTSRCIHKDTYRRVPRVDEGLGLCPNLIIRLGTIKDIIFKKIEERENAGYDSLTDSDVMDILDECERNKIELSRKELKRFGF